MHDTKDHVFRNEEKEGEKKVHTTRTYAYSHLEGLVVFVRHASHLLNLVDGEHPGARIIINREKSVQHNN